ncbi:MAG: cobyric acid synthase, partial [Thermodesulfobacteriota bacterium]
VAELAEVDVKTIELLPEQGFRLDCDSLADQVEEGDLVIIGSPNNPTATLVDSEDLKALARSVPGADFLVDEAFLDFVEGATSVAGSEDNISTLHSLTKFYGIPALRLGLGVFPRRIAAKLGDRIPPWSVNSLAQAVGLHLFDDSDYAEETRRSCSELRRDLVSGLKQFSGLQLFDSRVNYLLLKLRDRRGPELVRHLLEQKILVRSCANYDGLDDSYIRVAVRTQRENSRLLEGISTFFHGQTSKKVSRRKPAASLMFQGTSSNAGKSVLTAAFCRILIDEGLRVAPFKAQNMSLNSFVTHDGLEMGRAQVVQAQAARLDPDIRMNPILLKPNSDTGSQIIVRGKAVGNMNVSEYVRYKEEAVHSAHDCYDELAADYDVVLLEGAGSPGEVNLKSHDIVNMQMARYAESPVLLVGDIDRGGIYASFVGTMEVLDQWERELVAGFLVNRFRGQASLLQSAHDYVAGHTGREVMGVIPYLHDLGIPEEDSVSFKNGLFNSRPPKGDHVVIAALSLPHISNFTDLEPFLDEPDVHLRIIDHPDQLGRPDAVILPGSKNVIGDLTALGNQGFSEPLMQLAQNGCEIVGICGGYQMLGSRIEDPHGIESNRRSVTGLDLLKMATVLDPEKSLTRQEGVHVPSGCPIHGYEIHHGVSGGQHDNELLRFESGASCGTVDSSGRIWGSYLHGIFDGDDFRRWFIDRLRSRQGLPALEKVQAPYNLEPAFDRLADVVRRSVDMDRIMALLGL